MDNLHNKNKKYWHLSYIIIKKRLTQIREKIILMSKIDGKADESQ